MVSLYALLTGEACEALADGEEVATVSALFGALVWAEETDSEFADFGVDAWWTDLNVSTPDGRLVVWERLDEGLRRF
jgi:hypothetical protein